MQVRLACIMQLGPYYARTRRCTVVSVEKAMEVGLPSLTPFEQYLGGKWLGWELEINKINVSVSDTDCNINPVKLA